MHISQFLNPANPWSTAVKPSWHGHSPHRSEQIAHRRNTGFTQADPPDKERETFLHNICGELSDFTLQKTNPDTGESAFERKVKQNLSFDPAERYFNVQMLDLGKAEAQWKTVTAGERLNRNERSHKVLAEQSENLPPKKPK